jgi:PAS domain S-box-containing protein
VRSVVSTFEGLVEPTVVVVGEALDLDLILPPGARVLRVGPGHLDPEPAPIALAVLDARSYPLDVLRAARHSTRLGAVPALVLCGDDSDPALDTVGADDILAAPFGRSAASRVRVLIELGRTRFALWFAEQALEHSVSGLTIGDPTQPGAPIVHATSAFETITGYSLAEVRGQNCRFLQGTDTDPAARATLRAAIQDGRIAQVTLLNYKKDGTPFWNEVTVFPMRTPSGEPLRWTGGVQHDVTSLVEARAEVDRLLTLLLRRQAFDQTILNGVDVGIVTTDAYGRVTFVNRSARDVLGREGELDGLDVRALLALPDGPAVILRNESERRWPHSLRVGEREIEIDLSVTRAHASAQESLGFFYIFRDRTEEKQHEEDRRRLERLAAMGTMVAGFAHEIRNPMASLRSIAEALNDELVEAELKLPHVARMLKVLERVESLIRASLLFGRPSPPRRAAHRPWTILSAAVSALVPRTCSIGGELSIEAEPELPDVFVDDGQLMQALVILLNNALDATGSAQRVLLRARSLGAPSERGEGDEEPPSRRFVRFDVCDDGPGIAPDLIGRIFDPFFTTKASGTGLGLSIAQQLVTENASRLEVTSSAGGPTMFSVIVPRATTDSLSPHRVSRSSAPPPQSVARTGK